MAIPAASLAHSISAPILARPHPMRTHARQEDNSPALQRNCAARRADGQKERARACQA
ncbi:hypothetical protein KL86DES1_21235 [uncultured Desulfovibrio sp.]|uniref:Uncharacterized protein n=1 Tax=uncultured Desulfovibrio sp. TaxID=167968 RepID=A0A212L6X9_9BACT|nr:hypothetical protein KL86DES1_21235 [uncultured Desulfovibrio sp.]VZH34131.1 conserved protein of unknown function [Desulfovibrio sp. 86]